MLDVAMQSSRSRALSLVCWSQFCRVSLSFLSESGLIRSRLDRRKKKKRKEKAKASRRCPHLCCGRSRCDPDLSPRGPAPRLRPAHPPGAQCPLGSSGHVLSGGCWGLCQAARARPCSSSAPRRPCAAAPGRASRATARPSREDWAPGAWHRSRRERARPRSCP